MSFATNTNWQGYGGESTMSYLTQMLGLNVQNFLSAATGIAVLVALIRGFARRQAGTIGNFWVDLTRSTLYILLPLSFVLALVSCRKAWCRTSRRTPSTVPPLQLEQRKRSTREPRRMDASRSETRATSASRLLPQGPAASQVAIKQLGTNGGGFFNVNSAHPFENPTPLSNFLEVLAILLIPAALCFTFGRHGRRPRQGWAISPP